MPKFVVTISLPPYFTDEFTALIPPHWSFISKLIDEYIIEAYAIATDRTRGWITMNEADPTSVRALVEQMPLYPFFTQVEVDELFVYDSISSRFPRIYPN